MTAAAALHLTVRDSVTSPTALFFRGGTQTRSAARGAADLGQQIGKVGPAHQFRGLIGAENSPHK
jgi:hypothetical protein